MCVLSILAHDYLQKTVLGCYTEYLRLVSPDLSPPLSPALCPWRLTLLWVALTGLSHSLVSDCIWPNLSWEIKAWRRERVRRLFTQFPIFQVTWGLVGSSFRGHSFFPMGLYMQPEVAQLVKNMPAMWETWVQSLGWEDPLEKQMATHSSILAWRIPWTCIVHGVTRSQTQLSDFHFYSTRLPGWL